jgi:transposase
VQTCPKCGAGFAARGGAGYATLTVFRGGALDTKVRCPHCDHIFQPRAARAFVLKLLVGALVLVAIALIAYVLLLKPLLS